jgi:hypothetical protein
MLLLQEEDAAHSTVFAVIASGLIGSLKYHNQIGLDNSKHA